MKTLEELQELAIKMNYTLEELMYEMLCDSADDLMQKDKEIERLNNCINKIQNIINEYDFSIKEEWYEEPENWELDENCYAPSYIDLHKICLILKELKEESYVNKE